MKKLATAVRNILSIFQENEGSITPAVWENKEAEQAYSAAWDDAIKALEELDE